MTRDYFTDKEHELLWAIVRYYETEELYDSEDEKKLLSSISRKLNPFAFQD